MSGRESDKRKHIQEISEYYFIYLVYEKRMFVNLLNLFIVLYKLRSIDFDPNECNNMKLKSAVNFGNGLVEPLLAKKHISLVEMNNTFCI